MKFIHITILALLIFFFVGCRTLKTLKYIKNGSVYPTSFKTVVPFEMRFGLIVLKVVIHGKEYSFVLDTGAPNLISKELADLLGIKPVGKGKAHDSQGKSASIEFAPVDSIGIGGLQFLNTGAAIANMHQISDIGCFHIDGLIGANLMRKAVWQFDYERHIITITGSRDSLSIPADAKTINFRTANTGTPLIDVQLNGQTDHNVIIDLGSNGDFGSNAATLATLKENGLHTSSYSYGLGGSGLYGRGAEDTTWFAVIPSIQFDSVKLTNQVVYFSKNGAKTIGTNFFKHYRLIFDWSVNQLTMIPVSPYDNTHEKAYTFSVILKENKVFISSAYTINGVAIDGPQLGDQVLEFRSNNYRNCNLDSWCTLLHERYENLATPVSILVKRGDKELSFKVGKEALFQQK